MACPSVFSPLLHSRFHIQFSHRPVTPIPLRPPATAGSLDPPECVCVCVCVSVCVSCLIDHGCVPVALGSRCFYHCSVKGGDEGGCSQHAARLRGGVFARARMCVCVCDPMGFYSMCCVFSVLPSSPSFNFCNKHNNLQDYTSIITAYLV